MEQLIVISCVVGAGFFTWTNTENVLFTIGAVILGGFIGSLISFQIHESRRMKGMGFTTRKQLYEFDRDFRKLQAEIRPAIQERMKELDEQARAEGYSSHREKASAEAYKKLMQNTSNKE